MGWQVWTDRTGLGLGLLAVEYDVDRLGNLMTGLSLSRRTHPIFHRIFLPFSASPKTRGTPEVRQRITSMTVDMQAVDKHLAP